MTNFTWQKTFYRYNFKEQRTFEFKSTIHGTFSLGNVFTFLNNFWKDVDVENPPTNTEKDNVYGGGDTLPSYTEARQAEAPPPSYESLYGRVKAAKQESSSFVGLTILLDGMYLANDVSMLVVGAIHLDNCPAQKMIPIYLVVAGSLGIARNIFRQIQRCRQIREVREENTTKGRSSHLSQESSPKLRNPLVCLVDWFMFVWFIIGNVWIYGTTDRNGADTQAKNYCDDTLYYFAFWITTSMYIVMGTTCCCMCTFGSNRNRKYSTGKSDISM